jgi:hypothetical protein
MILSTSWLLKMSAFIMAMSEKIEPRKDREKADTEATDEGEPVRDDTFFTGPKSNQTTISCDERQSGS